MTRAVLFDLGNTLLDEQTNRPLPGATGLLDALGDVRDSEGLPVLFGLVSDWKMPRNPAEVGPLRQEYLQELAASGLDAFFRPLETRVTLSTDVGVRKPDAAIFRAALDHLQPGLPFHQAVFVTERLEHVQAARALGLLAIHFKGPGQTTGDVEQFADLLELLKRIVVAAPPCKKHDEAVGRFESQAAKSKQADPAVTALVAQVSPARLGDRIRALSDFGTRWTYSSNIGQSACVGARPLSGDGLSPRRRAIPTVRCPWSRAATERTVRRGQPTTRDSSWCAPTTTRCPRPRRSARRARMTTPPAWRCSWKWPSCSEPASAPRTTVRRVRRRGAGAVRLDRLRRCRRCRAMAHRCGHQPGHGGLPGSRAT